MPLSWSGGRGSHSLTMLGKWQWCKAQARGIGTNDEHNDSHMYFRQSFVVKGLALVENETNPIALHLRQLLDANQLEPVPHALLREAWSQRHSNPNSSLLIGMAALEVGVKDYIAACMPAAAWLAENVPSPRSTESSRRTCRL
jgi:hypothetical protein